MPWVIPPWVVSPFSAWEDDEVSSVAGAARLADDLDPTTAELRSFDGVHPVDAIVQRAFQIVRDQGAANGSMGHIFRTIQYADERARDALIKECARIMRPFVERSWISFDSVDGIVVGDTGQAEVHYTNLLTREKRGFSV